MTKKKKQESAESGFEGVENALSRTEQYIEENQKSLTIIVAAIIIIVGGYLGYRKFIVSPKEKEASSQMYMAEQYFERDSFNLALYGDGQNLGFIDIIDEYGITKSANLANYYAGVSYLHMGDFDMAIEYLKQFDAEDDMIAPIAYGAIGDAYSELQNYEEAADFYIKASKQKENEFVAPIYLMKAGLVYEELGEHDKAVAVYQRIKDDYGKSSEARQIDKYITRAKIKAEQ